MRHALTRPQGFRWVVLVAGLSAAQVGCQPAKANPEDLQAKFVAAALSPAGAERDRALAKILPDGKIEEWTGTLDTVARNSTGRFHVVHDPVRAGDHRQVQEQRRDPLERPGRGGH